MGQLPDALPMHGITHVVLSEDNAGAERTDRSGLNRNRPPIHRPD
jgi:hypothetical protein